MPKRNQYRLEVRFGDDLLEAGFTAVPNLFLNNYRDLGISDSVAFWIVHLLKFKWTEDNPYPRRSSIPMKANRDTQQRYARQLRKLGLLFTQRIYWSAEDNPPKPELVGKIRALKYDFTSLFHNVVRISRWKADKRPLDEFRVEIPLEIMEKVASGHFHDVPKKWRHLCEQQMQCPEPTPATTEESLEGPAERSATSGGSEKLLGENHMVGKGTELPCENHMADSQELPGENHMEALPCDSQMVENHPNNKEDTIYNKKHNLLEKKGHQQQNTDGSISIVAVVSPDELKDLILKNDEVIVDRNDDGLELTVMTIPDAVKYKLERQSVEPFYQAGIYYSVEHALGEGPDDWTEEELARIGKKATIERELGERHERLGAFTLEEALQHYFTPQLAARFLSNKTKQELERIENWVAYVRQQKNLHNPAGFLRTKIESSELPPLPGRGS